MHESYTSTTYPLTSRPRKPQTYELVQRGDRVIVRRKGTRGRVRSGVAFATVASFPVVERETAEQLLAELMAAHDAWRHDKRDTV